MVLLRTLSFMRIIEVRILANNFSPGGSIDEFLLTICPDVLGSGKSIFDGGVEKIRLKLLSSRTLKSGIIATRYEMEKISFKK